MARSTLFLLVVLVPGAAAAQLLVPHEAGAPGHPASPLSIRHQEISVEVDTQVARTRVTQVFENHTDRPLRGRYVFALPERAAVSNFATWVGGRRVESRVERRERARETFEQAAEAGRAPGLLESLGPGVFQTTVDAIPAGGTKRVEIEYSEVLPYEAGRVILRIPLTVPSLETPTIRDLRVRIRLAERDKTIGAVEMPGYPMQLRRIDDRHVELSTHATNDKPTSDLVVSYAVQGDEMGLSFITHRMPGEDGYFLLSIAPQELTRSEDIVKKDIFFVFDTSGSMAGPKIRDARRALLRMLGMLQPEDAFSILAFSDGMNPWRSSVKLASKENIGAARAFVRRLKAGGGTHIAGALEFALTHLPDRGRPRVLIFFTDGQPTVGLRDPDRILARVRNLNRSGTRIFTFGVTGGVDARLLDDLARENRGASAYVDGGASIDAVVAGFYQKISRPVLADIEFEYEPVTTRLQYPQVLPDIYKGQQLIVVGRYHGEGRGRLTLRGTLNGVQKTLVREIDFPAQKESDAFVARVWAQRRVRFLLDEMDRNGETPEMRDEVIALAEAYHLVTPYTSMVTVAEPTLASLSPSRIKPGDPEVLIRAPRSALAVVLHLPFGEVVRARWDPRRARWRARFLVPGDLEDGVYPVRLVVMLPDGTVERHRLSFTIDTRAPVMALDLPRRLPAGALLRIRARPKIDPGSILEALSAGGRAAIVEMAKTFTDVKAVSVRLWDGRTQALRVSPRGEGWVAEIETECTQPPGRYPLTVSAVDWAGNLRQERAEVLLVAPEAECAGTAWGQASAPEDEGGTRRASAAGHEVAAR